MSNGTTSSGGTGTTGATGLGPGGSVQSPLTLLVPMTEEGLKVLGANLQKVQDTLQTGLDEIGLVHFVRLLFLPGTTTLAIITSYDGSFDDYILAFVQNDLVAETFDLFLKYVDDTNTPPDVPKGTQCIPVQQNANAFVQFLHYYDYTNVERRGTFAWYSAYPTVTVKMIFEKFGMPERPPVTLLDGSSTGTGSGSGSGTGSGA
jgi:hypothetical protein